MIVFCRETEVVPQTSSRVTPAEKDGRRSEGQNASGNRRVYDLVTFILIMYTGDYLKEVVRFVREIDGVESVKVGSTSNKIEVKGKVDPKEIQKKVKRKTKRKVKLIFPSTESEGYGDKTKRPDEKLEEKTRPDDNASAKSEEGVTVLKIKFCCDSCNQKIKNILKVKGLETVAIDTDKDLVTVKGTVNMPELKSSMKEVLKKEKDIQVVVPAKKKDTVSTKKKDIETGAINKKDKDVGPTDKKGKEVGAMEKTVKDKKTVLADKNSKGKGKAGVPSESENKGNGVNQKKGRRSGHRKNEETFSDGSRRGNNQEDVIGVPVKGYPPYNQRSVDYVYAYSSSDHCHHRRPVNCSNGYNMDHMFSDENPHSCTIL